MLYSVHAIGGAKGALVDVERVYEQGDFARITVNHEIERKSLT